MWPFSKLREQQERINLLEMTNDEGSELLAEAHCAMAGLAGELLEPCGDPSVCAGHFKAGTKKLYRRGLRNYDRLARATGASDPREVGR